MEKSDLQDFPVPKPSWMVGATAAIGYVILLLGLDATMPTIDPRLAPVAIVGGVVIYAMLLWLFDFRDPRLWRDTTRFADYVNAWATTAGKDLPDETGRERLRAMTWHDASIAMAQQTGAVAGAGAGAVVIDYGWPLVLGVFGGTMIFVGFLVRKWLLSSDRRTLGPLLDSDK